MHRTCALITVLLGAASSASAGNPQRPMNLIPVVGRDGKPVIALVGGKILRTPNGVINTGRPRASSIHVNPAFKISAQAGGPAC